MYKFIHVDKDIPQETILVDMRNISKWHKRPKWMRKIKRIATNEIAHPLDEDSESTVEEDNVPKGKIIKEAEVDSETTESLSLEEDSLRPEVKKKLSIRKKRPLKELETGVYKKGDIVDVSILESEGIKWLCGRIAKILNFRNSIVRYKIVLKDGRKLSRKEKQIRICSHAGEISSFFLQNSTSMENTPTVTTDLMVCLPVGDSTLGNKEEEIWKDDRLRKGSNSIIPSSISTQEAIELSNKNDSDEIVMIIGGSRISLSNVNINITRKKS